MATANPFDLLVDDDNEDLTLLVAAAQQAKVEKPKKAPPPGQGAQPAAKLPSKPLPPAQAMREARNEGGRGGSRGGGRGHGRGRGGGRGSDRDSSNYENSFGSNNGFSGGYRPSEEENSGRSSERRGGSRGGFRGGRRGGFSNGEDGEDEHPRRVFERRSGTGHGNEMKRDGSGRGNWGTPADEVAVEAVETVKEDEKIVDLEKPVVDDDVADSAKESPADEAKEQEPEDKEMTLEEYEKVLEEKRKVLLALKTEERKVDKKAFESMQLLSNKKSNNDVFIKLGSEKDRRKDADKEDKAKKSVSINDFLKPAEGDRYYSPGGRGRGRGRGPRSGGYGGGYGGGNSYYNTTAPAIEDLGQFPSLGGKI